MAQPKIINHTALTYETLFATDEVLRPILTPIVKATFDILEDGQLKFAPKQVPVNLEGEYTGEPESSSYVFEPETAFIKLNTDIVIIGDAISTRGPVPHLLVEIKVGHLHKSVGVIGDRVWLRQATGYRVSDITPFERMPINYENAFGGWDTRHADPSKHDFESRNTVGKGFYVPGVEHIAPLPLPNIENPDQLIKGINDRPQPVGIGFTLPHWQPRASLAGTYDEKWQASSGGKLPEDFNRLFFNAASQGMVANGYLAGNEEVVITHMTPNPRLAFSLPGVRAPVCKVQTVDDQCVQSLNLDTVIIDTRNMQLHLLWRNIFPLVRSAHDVLSIDIRYG